MQKTENYILLYCAKKEVGLYVILPFSLIIQKNLKLIISFHFGQLFVTKCTTKKIK